MRNKTGRPAGSGSALARIVAAVAVALCLSLTPTLVTFATAETADDGIATLELDEDDYATEDDAAEASEDDLATTAPGDGNEGGGNNNGGDQNQNPSTTLTVSIVDSDGNTISANSSSSVTTSFTVDSTGVTFASSATSSFTSGTGTSETTYTYSSAQIYVNNSWVTITAIRYTNGSYEYTTDGSTWTSDGSSVTVRLVYTASSSSNSTELDITKYLNSSLVLWDINDSSGDYNSQDGDDGTASLITSVTLNSTTVNFGESTTVSTGTGTGGWGNGTALSTYFPDTSDGTYYGGSSSSTVALTITPAAGYYVTSVVIACAPTSGGQSDSSTQLTPYSCSTWSSGNATNSTFSDTTGGSVSLQVSNLSFSHTSQSGYYFILITVAKIPTPLYVEYSYGEIVDYLVAAGVEDSTTYDTSAFSTATGWTTASSSNVYTYSTNDGTDGGVQTSDVQFKYTYSESDSSANSTNWKHYANSITDAAAAAAAQAGYVFAGWEVTYYTTMGTVTAVSSTGTYEDDTVGTADGAYYAYGGDSASSTDSESDVATASYNVVGDSYGYPFDSSTLYGKTFVKAGEEVTLTTHCYIKAIWVKVDTTGQLKITKTVDGNAANPDDTTTHYTFTITSASTTTNEDGTTTTTYDIPDGTYKITFTLADGCVKSVTEHGSSVSSTDSGYTITFSGGTATVYLANGETATIEGLPTGAKVTVTESDSVTGMDAYASTSVATSTETSSTSSGSTDDGSTDGGTTEDDEGTSSTAPAAAEDDESSGDGTDTEGGTTDDSTSSGSTSTSTYSATVTIPVPSSYKVNVTVTPGDYDSSTGLYGSYTYSYTLSDLVTSTAVVAFTNTFSLSPDNGAGAGAPVAMAAVLVVAAGGIGALAWSGRRRRVRP